MVCRHRPVDKVCRLFPAAIFVNSAVIGSQIYFIMSFCSLHQQSWWQALWRSSSHFSESCWCLQYIHSTSYNAVQT